ncbi:transcriptional attenuator, LytR family [Paenibacillus sp. 1_12]|uniref:LCP family protein n=1 Tax=Paenibacillus sp. 1_12 TaxID=1566278 RepID=UPI0008E0CFBD|nr:LCP family protein [Paenibacillus sp. 1_12]SFL66693.1 transcriptional attenuator, LytR family [Paenibacillus sp. 1_12]
MKKKIWIITSLCVILLAGVTGLYTYSIYSKAEEAINKISDPTSVTVPVKESAKVKPLTLLLMGIDYRPETGSLNSDVIMVVTLNPDKKSATLVSLPRDLQLDPKGLEARKANYYYPHFMLKDKETAFANTKQIFSDLLGIPIDYAVTVDFDGFRKVVDLMGGLTIDIDMDMRYVDDEDGTDINLKKGTALLDGKKVLDFVRYRKSNRNTEESSDLERNQRQQQVLNELLSSLKSVDGVTKLGTIIGTLGDHIRTDVPASQLRDFLRTYYDISPENVQYMPLDGEWISPYIVVSDEELNKARNALKMQLNGGGLTDTGMNSDYDMNPKASPGNISNETNSGSIGKPLESSNETRTGTQGAGTSTGTSTNPGKNGSAGTGTSPQTSKPSTGTTVSPKPPVANDQDTVSKSTYDKRTGE